MLGAAMTAHAAPGPFPYPLKMDTLPNGLTVVRVAYPSPGLLAYATVVRVGSRNEVEPGRSGYAHFFEHMMFRGTAKHPPGARERFLQSNGFLDNAFTTDDFTLYHTTGPSTALEQLVEVEADRFQHLAYEEPAFQTEARAVLGEYRKDAASPDLKVEEGLAATAFTTHPYRHTTLGFLKDIEAMPQGFAYSREFFKRWYTPDNAMIFVVGDFDDAKLMKAITAAYGDWAGKASTVHIPGEPPQKDQRTKVVEWPEPTLPRLYNAWHVPGASLKTNDAALIDVLGGYLAGPTSPLYKQLVLEKQWAESVGDQTTHHRDPHLLLLGITLKDAKHIDGAQKVINTEVKALVTGKVDKKRVEAVKSNLHYGLYMGLSTPEAVAQALAVDAAIFGAPDALAREMEAISKVKPEQLQPFAKRALVARNRTVLTLRSTVKPQQTATR
jgi:zinc protease